MAFTNIHPAPGVGELMPGFYVVPQNPIAMAQTGMGYFARMGELLPGAFTVPQNPIVKNFASGMQGLGTMGCAPGSQCGGGFTGALAGMGLGDEPAVQGIPEAEGSAFLPSTWDKSTIYILLAGAAVLFLSFRPDTGQKRSELKKLRGAYERQEAAIKGKYKTWGGRGIQAIKDKRGGAQARKASEATSLMPFD